MANAGSGQLPPEGSGPGIPVTPVRITQEQISEVSRSPAALDKTFVRKLKKTSTTPTVANTEVCIAQNTGAVTVTDFLDGADGQHLYILGDGQTTVANGAPVKTNTGANKLLAANKFYHFINFSGTWVEQA